ncbi:polysaccharide pyruvyl transferase family protein [Demequina muriae]|uniref:Polysaccharide pyruvyl transferase family protein n=1 Tax=Demequina muriae TaxID=3051664 RepID=A0ABT8GF82_9MICO|nr:polysaccharide pyruvyl transferase family protein [Demequina sp. EGI L300058]MDN4480089.1 polysaccharide pyruvyl transferase family protein [Demequina sp. EGI L300058]
MNVLVVNSDLAANRGDRAIAAGLVALVRALEPGARITLISQHADRDRDWYGVDVLPQNIHSLNPLDLLRLMRAARRADVVLWGGGELLKDYTNRLGVWYWAVKMRCVSAANPRVVGTFQGIGRTRARSSRRLIARTVSRTRTFLTRDAQSRELLESWGVRPGIVTASYDCAVYAADARPESASDVPFERFAVVAPRQWFHYREGGWLPHRWRRGQGPSAQSRSLATTVVSMVDALVESHGAVVLAPMHMGEDPAYARELRDRAARPDRVHVLDGDELGPEALRSVIARADVMVALRLHAGIVATSVGVPTVTYYYVDKGRLYAEQLGAQEYTRPIERLLEPDALADLTAMVAAVEADGEQRARTHERIGAMREHLRDDLAAALAAARS